MMLAFINHEMLASEDAQLVEIMSKGRLVDIHFGVRVKQSS